MIEVINNKESNLKNLKQIGTPRGENKIYIENLAYNKIREESYKEKSVFVLMGHTERMQGRYASFIEAVIPVREIEFVGNIPKWNSATWSKVFREIKRLYEDMIIVGWAIEIKGMSPKLTPDLERVHREHFGGVHQLLFLLDTVEKEETFYMYKENKLISRDGFYVYHKVRMKKEVSSKVPETGVDVEFAPTGETQKGMYRTFLLENKRIEKEKPEKRDKGNMGIVAAVAMLVFVIGVGVYENSGSILGESVPTNQIQSDASVEENEALTESETEEGTTETSGEKIDVEIVPGNE